jgi:hypothetical protein
VISYRDDLPGSRACVDRMTGIVTNRNTLDMVSQHVSRSGEYLNVMSTCRDQEPAMAAELRRRILGY